MTVSAAVVVEPHDRAMWINRKGKGVEGTRYINRSKITLAEEKTMGVTAAVVVVSHDVASRVGRERKRGRGSRDIDRCELLLRGQPNRDW